MAKNKDPKKDVSQDIEEPINEEAEDSNHTEISIDEELVSRIATLEEQVARSKADYANLQRRTDQEKSELGNFIISKFLKDLLPQLDNLQRANETTPEKLAEDTWAQGYNMSTDSLFEVLQKQGVEVFSPLGDEIDPDKHEVLSQADGKENTVVNVFERGYTLHGKVIRPAKVVAGNGQ